MKNLSAPRRLGWSQFTKLLGLPNQGELQKLRVKCQRGAIPCTFPSPGPGGFLESEVHAFKKVLDAIVTQVDNTQPASPSPHDRRAISDRRQR